VRQDAKKVAPRGPQDSSSSDCLHPKAGDKFQLKLQHYSWEMPVCDRTVVRIPTIAAQDCRSFDAAIPCLSNSEMQKPGDNRLPGLQDHIWCPLAAGVAHRLLLNPNRSSVTPQWKDESDQRLLGRHFLLVTYSPPLLESSGVATSMEGKPQVIAFTLAAGPVHESDKIHGYAPFFRLPLWEVLSTTSAPRNQSATLGCQATPARW
jgi:hypothetical protein